MAEPPLPAEAKGVADSETMTTAAGATTVPTSQQPTTVAVEDDSDPDFDDLDDVLDQFSANAPSASASTKPVPPLSGPGRPPELSSGPQPTSDVPIPSGPLPTESEEDFVARLTAEMSSVMSALSADPAASASSPEEVVKMGKELEEFTQRMEAEGIKPEDLLKAILGEQEGAKVAETAEQERERRESQSQSRSPEAPRDGPSGSASKAKLGTSFDSTIRDTMARMSDSSAKATSASQQKSEEDMLTEMLRALESGGDGSDGDISKMFLGMMEQLTNKEMLYEPMKELDTKYPEWLTSNKSKLPKADYERFTRQKVIVSEIVTKFEEKDFSDDDPKCREFIWEKMQQMQAEGAPPEDLVANPLAGGGIPGMPPGMGLGGDGPEEGCPTQ